MIGKPERMNELLRHFIRQTCSVGRDGLVTLREWFAFAIINEDRMDR
jgi:hypothetical protein